MKSGSWLARDIGWVLAFKAAALFLLYLAFFHHPIAPGLTPARVADHVMALATGTIGSNPAEPDREAH